jgi:Leucine-rich repeat (LRR) protein
MGHGVLEIDMLMKISQRFCAVLLLFQLTFPNAYGQTGSAMEEKARSILAFTDQDKPFDRITRVGECTVYEMFSPPSFAAITQRKGEILVAAYSKTNLFQPEMEVEFPSGTARQLVAEGVPTAVKALKGIRTFKDPVGPLVRTQWGQGKYFNYECPADPAGPNGHVLPGCMAVALAQMVRYYGAYNDFKLVHAFQSGRYGMLDAEIGPYRWDRMENTLVAVNREVCDMLYDFSVLLHTAYSTTGSSANSHRTLEAIHELGFTEASLVRKADFSPDAWTDLLYSNLMEYKPVLVTGGGHAFICDGFDKEGMLHFNLGGAGYGDGYYMPGVLVLGYPVSEMFIDLYPACLPPLAKSIAVRTGAQFPLVVWSPAHQSSPAAYRIYVDEIFHTQTNDTVFIANNLEPGLHTVHVSTLTPEGESRWIGPVDVFIRGNLFTINDNALFSALLKALGYGRDVNTQDVFEGDLSRIISLEISEPLLSLEGIGLCKQLRKLTVSGFPGPGLDAGPLGNLKHLQVLELHGKISVDSQVLGNLANLSELRFFNCPLPSLGFLSQIPGLLKFSYCGVPLPEVAPISLLSELDELDLSQTDLSDVDFAPEMHELRQLRLGGNRIKDVSFLQKFPKLISADLSGNFIEKVVLTDQLQCLVNLDLHANRIQNISASSELRSLEKINLSGNELTSPGRLMLYTPALREINLADNMINAMGKYHPEQLMVMNVSGNQLITTEWADLFPNLMNLDISDNRISDLAGVVRLTSYRQMDYLSVEGNPLSKETFETQIPLLREKSNSLKSPDHFQPLSPCYPTPVRGGRFASNDYQLQWEADRSCGNCVFDLYKVEEDSLVLLKSALEEPQARVEERPQGVLKWMVASRTADTVFWSGVYSVYPEITWTLPFAETFESYASSSNLNTVSDFWLVKGNVDGKYEASIQTSESRNGAKSLELKGSASSMLPMEPVEVPDLTIRFSVRVPEGHTGQLRINNLSGIEFRVECEAGGTALAYVSDRLVASFPLPVGGWMDYKISANARNNQIFVWAGTKLIVNQPWMFPSGKVRISGLEFNASPESADWDPSSRLMYVDDITLQSSQYTGIEDQTISPSDIQAFPNPCSDVLTVKVPVYGRCRLTVMDMSGRTLMAREYQQTGASEINLPVESLPEGIYTLQVMSDTAHQSIRIVKSRSGY